MNTATTETGWQGNGHAYIVDATTRRYVEREWVWNGRARLPQMEERWVVIEVRTETDHFGYERDVVTRLGAHATEAAAVFAAAGFDVFVTA